MSLSSERTFGSKAPKIKTMYFLALAFMLALASFSSLPVFIGASAATSSSGCPSNEILHITWYAGLPTSFNNLAPFNPPGVFAQIEAVLTGGAPPVFPDGTPANFMTVANAITHNANYTVWTISIKPGIKWYNGTAVNPADYLGVFSPNFALNPAYDPIGLHSEVTSVSAINSSAVQFTLNQTDAHFSERIDNYFTSNLYPTSFTSQNVTYNGFGLDFGDGPFYISNYQAGQSELIMLRNPYYQPQPKLCEIDWNFVESESATATYIASGASDMAPVAAQSVRSIIGNPNIRILNQPEWMTYLQYNVSVYPYNMTQFRQALAYGINQSQLAQVGFAGYATPAYSGEGTIRPSTQWYNPNQVSYSYNPTQALSLLHSIGFTTDSSGTLHFPNGTAVSLNLFTDSGQPADAVMAQFIAQELKPLGITLNINVNSLSTTIGMLFSNGQNIQHSMIVYTSEGIVNTPYYMSQPPAFTWELPGPTPNPSVAPASANAQYLGNVSALTATDNPALESQYINNIQSIYAQYLPTLPLLYVDNTVAVNTAHFTGWPSSNGYLFGDGFWNLTALANLAPASTSSTSASSTAAGSSPTASSGSATSQTSATASTSTVASSALSTGTTSAAGGLSTTALVAIGVVVVIIVVALGLIFARRRGGGPS